MPRIPVAIVGPSYTTRSRDVDAQRTVNLYPEIAESNAPKSVACLIGTPGLVSFAEVGSGPIRGFCLTASNRLFVVSCNELYELLSDGSATLRGGIGTTSGLVSMDENGNQVAIADGGGFYIYDLAASTMTQVSGVIASSVGFLDGYFVLDEPETGRFRISSLYDGDTIDGLDFATAEGAPDDVVTLAILNRQVILFGSNSTEFWVDSGDADFPFDRLDGGFIQFGCIAPKSVKKVAGTLCWLGNNEEGPGQVYMLDGYQARRVSTHAVETALKGLDFANAYAWSYSDEGHHFYCLSVPNAETTWVFDVTTGMWHEEGSWNEGYEPHRAACHVYAFGKHLVGDRETGDIYELSADAYSDNGAPLRRARRTPHAHANLMKLFWHTLEIDFETGVGLNDGQGSDPKCLLRWSDDGGHAWSAWRETSLGRIGDRKARAVFRRLGSSRDRVFEVVVSDPVKCVIIDAKADVTEGAN